MDQEAVVLTASYPPLTPLGAHDSRATKAEVPPAGAVEDEPSGFVNELDPFTDKM